MSGRIRQHADIGKARGDASGYFLALALPEFDIDLRMRGKPWRQAAWKNLHDGRRICDHPDIRAQAPREAPHFPTHEGRLIQDFARVVGKCLPRLRQRNAPASPFEQADVSGGLHFPQAITGRCKRKTDLRRSVGDAASLSHGEKETQVDEVEAHP
ncbi:hypothetical protein GCM10007923_33960 [Shinella yambaruensis]|uniref:Uncharacterized protein n=1 Tax=Shinella yambaruensis TaxID=415996 RepID=A0ABQ5ZH95_9HYPH|nr:hypothetical protein GCM10007923_33960 [Shinella yambaruensis]